MANFLSAAAVADSSVKNAAVAPIAASSYNSQLFTTIGRCAEYSFFWFAVIG